METLQIGSQNGVRVADWRIRVLRDEPSKVNEEEVLRGTTWADANRRAYILSRRTSYVVNGPNARVCCIIDRWSSKRGKWVTVFECVTKLKDGAMPV